ncbi:MAG: cyclopropane-fatty-acyl-phospholipid synthase family protein [Bacillota bacterium]
MLEKALMHNIFRRARNRTFVVTYPDGEKRRYRGDGDEDGRSRFHLIFKTPLGLRNLRTSPMLTLGEGYMDERLDVDGNLCDVLDMGIDIMEDIRSQAAGRKEILARFLRRQKDADAGTRSEGVRHHYDIGNEFFSMWLDPTMTYSCAYFRSPEDSLELAQEQKIDHILRKLSFEECQNLLDIGSGWAHLIMRAARNHGVRATGVTLSEEQLREARRRIRGAGLSDTVTVELADFRELVNGEDKYDRIVSVGMFEHVGKEHISEYFESVRHLLKPGGLSLLHTLTHPTEGPSNPWLEKYIFPWGYIPSVRETLRHLPEFGFHLLDVESLRRHYALTTERWADNFEDVHREVRRMYGERFVRMWRLFLSGCAVSFWRTGLDVHQILFSRGLNNDLPLTRDYMYPEDGV